MAEGDVVQGNTESTPDTGVYSDTTTVTGQPMGKETVVPPQQIDPAVTAATQAAVKEPETKPEPIEYKFTTPEGLEMNQVALDSFIPIMQKLGISQEDAQALVDVQSNISLEAKKAHETAVETARESWVKEITADPELGGEKLKETLHIANQGLQKVGVEEFTKLLTDTGLGDHPAVIRAFHKIGLMNADDQAVFGNPAGGTGIGNMYENSPELK
jgi:hypothetical protein